MALRRERKRLRKVQVEIRREQRAKERSGEQRPTAPPAPAPPVSATLRDPFRPFWRNLLTPRESEQATDAVLRATGRIMDGAREFKREVEQGVAHVLAQAEREREREAAARQAKTDALLRDLRKRWRADKSPERGSVDPRIPIDLLTRYASEDEWRDYMEEQERQAAVTPKPKYVETDRGRVQQFGIPDREARQNRRAVGLAAAAIPVGRGGSLVTRAARYALRRPVRATVIGTGAAHATGHLELPQRQEGEHAGIPGIPIPGEPGWVERAGRALIDAGLYAGPAVYEAGKAVVLDSRTAARGDTSFKRSRQMGIDVGKAIKHGVLNPTEPESFVQNLLLLGGAANIVAHGVERARAGTPLRTPAPGTTELRAPAPKGKIGLELLVADARRSFPTFHRHTKKVAKATGAEHVRGGIKKSERSQQKIAVDYGDDPTYVKDLARNALIVDEPQQIAGIIEQLRRAGVLEGAKDTLSRPDADTGYGDLKLYVRHGGHVAETQVVPRPIYEARKQLEEVRGRWRAAKAGSPEEAHLAAIMRQRYEAAFAEWAARSRSQASRSTVTPSDSRVPWENGRPSGTSQARVSRDSGSNVTGIPSTSMKTAPRGGSAIGSDTADILSQLDLPPGSIRQQRPGLTAVRDEPDAPILRYGHRARTRWLNWRLSNPDHPFNRWAPGRAENVLARARDATDRVLTDADRARVNALRARAEKLSQPEHDAATLIYIFGRDPKGGRYALNHPDEVVNSAIAVERAYARRAKQRDDRDGEAMHLAEVEALEAARAVLHNPSPDFVATVIQGQRLSRRGEQEDIQRGDLDVAQTESRKARMAFIYGHGAPGRALAGETLDDFMGRAARTQRKLAGEAERLKWKLRGALRANPSPEMTAAREAEAAANRAAEVASAARGRALDTYLKAKAKLERKERTLLNEQTNPRGTPGGIAKRAREVQQAKRDLKTARDDLVRLRREAPVHVQRLAELNRALNEQAARERRTGAIAEQEARLAIITGERARIAQEAAAAQGLQVPGATFFSTAEHFKLPMRSTQVRGSRTGQGLSIGPPQTGRFRFGSQKRFTGRGLERTGQVQRPITAIAELQAGRVIAHAQEDLYLDLWNTASPRRASEQQVAIRSGRQNPLDLKRLDRAVKAAEAGDDTPLGDFLRSRFDDLVIPESEARLVEVGETIPGVRWVDKALVRRLAPTNPSDHILMRAARAINRPGRFFGVYARPGYVATNRPGNEAMGIFLHGPKAFSVGKRHRLRHSLGEEGLAVAEGVAGTSRTESYRIGAAMARAHAAQNPVGRALGQTGRAADWIEKRIVRAVTNTTDRSFRLRMFEIRAAQLGYHGADSLRYLLNSRDRGVRADLAAAGRRSRRDSVDFDSLSPPERQLAEVFFFYPWTSRSFAWTGRFAVNRPLTAGTVAAASQVAQEREPDWLRKGPDWLRGYIATDSGKLFSLGGLSTPATPAQTTRSALKIGEGLVRRPKPGQERSFARELGTPLLQLVGGETAGGVFGTSGIGALAGIGPEGKTFPENSFEERLKRFLGGSLAPRRPDRDYMRKKWLEGLPAEERIRERAKERDPEERDEFIRAELRAKRREDLPAGRKAYLSAYDERQETLERAKTVGMPLEEGKLPQWLREAYDFKARRDKLIAEAREGIPSGTREYALARYLVDEQMLVRAGFVKAEAARRAIQIARTATKAEIEQQNRSNWGAFFHNQELDGPLYRISYAKRQLTEAEKAKREKAATR